MSQSRGDTAVASREEAENVYVNGMAGNELAGYVQQGRDFWFPVQCWVLDAVPGSRAPDCVRGESHLGRRPRGWSPPPSRLTLCVCVRAGGRGLPQKPRPGELSLCPWELRQTTSNIELFGVLFLFKEWQEFIKAFTLKVARDLGEIRRNHTFMPLLRI